MVKDDPAHEEKGRCCSARQLAAKAAVVVLLVVGISFAYTVLTATRQPSAAPPGATPPAPQRLFRDWPANRVPDLVLILSGQTFGYLQPCGCSEPQFGGLERRFTFIEKLKQRSWPVVAFDLGDIAPKTGLQWKHKYTVAMQALHQMGYAAVGIGQYEADKPLIEALGEYSLNHPEPVVLGANLADKVNNFPAAQPNKSMVSDWVLAGGQGTAPRVAATSVIGPSVAAQMTKYDASLKFESNLEVLPRVLKQLEAKKPELLVLLYQGTAEEAKKLAQAFPQFLVILCTSREDEPSDKPERVKDTLIISVGHKGRYVGAVGVWRTEGQRPFDLRYQLCPMGPELKTPPGQEARNPILAKLENYTATLKKENFLAKYPQQPHPIQVEFREQFPDISYVGSQKCQKCHPEAYEVWEKSGHAHAYQSLVDARRPSLCQFDGECIICHVVGFGYQTGFKTEETTPLLKDVGCESCHGPCSVHVKLKKNTPDRMMALMNPHKSQPGETNQQMTARLNRMDQSCQKCHDTDNDVHWNFAKKWPKIAHPTPKAQAAPAQGQ